MAISRLTGLQRLSASGGLSSRSSSNATVSSVRSVVSDIGPTTAVKETTKTSASVSVSGTTSRKMTTDEAPSGVVKSRSLDLKTLSIVQSSVDVKTHGVVSELSPRVEQSNDEVPVVNVSSDVVADELSSSSGIVEKSCSSVECSLIDDVTLPRDENNIQEQVDDVDDSNKMAVTAVTSQSTTPIVVPQCSVTSQVPDVPDVIDRRLTPVNEPCEAILNDVLAVSDNCHNSNNFNVMQEKKNKPISMDSNRCISDGSMSSVLKPELLTVQSSGSDSPVSSSSSVSVTWSSDSSSSRTGRLLSQTDSRTFAAARKNFEPAETTCFYKTSSVPEGRIGVTTNRRKVVAGFLNTNSLNSATSSNSASSLKSKMAPMFVRKMKNVTVAEGGTARFDVLVKANPTASVVWMKDGIELDMTSQSHSGSMKYRNELSEDEGRCTLLVAECGEDDDAEYGCRATNSLGHVSSKAELYVEPAGDGEE